MPGKNKMMACACARGPATERIRIVTLGSDEKKVFFAVRWCAQCFAEDQRAAIRDFGYRPPVLLESLPAKGWGIMEGSE